MSDILSLSLVQLQTSSDIDENLKKIDHYLNLSKESDLVIFPENVLINCKGSERHTHAHTLMSSALRTCCELAKTYQTSFILGSIPETAQRSKKTYQTLIWIGEEGEILAKYRKIHLFKVDYSGITVDENDWIEQGDPTPLLLNFKGWNIGLSICYDLRFPELYRALMEKGSELMVVPSSFTFPTGEAHWHTLLRARAIENLCYVLGVNQVGKGGSGYENFGHTLAVSPWGEVIAEYPKGEGVLNITLKKQELVSARARLPSLEHQRIKIGSR